MSNAVSRLDPIHALLVLLYDCYMLGRRLRQCRRHLNAKGRHQHVQDELTNQFTGFCGILRSAGYRHVKPFRFHAIQQATRTVGSNSTPSEMAGERGEPISHNWRKAHGWVMSWVPIGNVHRQGPLCTDVCKSRYRKAIRLDNPYGA